MASVPDLQIWLQFRITGFYLQCWGSASIIMRIWIQIQDPKYVHMDPDPDADPNPDPRG